MYILKTSVRVAYALSIGFNRDCELRQQELTDNKNPKGKNHVRNRFRDFFRFAEHREQVTYG